MRIFMLKFTILLLETLFLFDAVPDLILIPRFQMHTLNGSFLFWIRVKECFCYIFFRQTVTKCLPGPVSPSGNKSLLMHPVGKSLIKYC